MSVLKSQRTKGDAKAETALPKASTDFFQGYWLQYDIAGAAGAVKPLTPTARVVGLCGETITESIVGAVEYANPINQLHFDMVDVASDRFTMPVTNGTALATMRGSTFDIFTDFYGLDVSTAGTQFRITQVFSATEVEVEVNPVLVA